MNKQDNFFQQFKEAADKTEQHRFPGFDEVWEQVETRLDKKEQPKVVSFHYKKWLAIAATLLVMLFAGVVIYQSNKNITPIDTVVRYPSPKPELQAEPNNPTQSVVADESLTGTTT